MTKQEAKEADQTFTNKLSVYQAIAAVQKEMSSLGISKDRKNKEQGYQFRGIDDVYNALAPQLSKHGLCILPRILTRSLTERTSKSGTALFNVVVEAEFDFVSASDNSKHTVRTYGEAMDSADKATNKAMSAAFKYACLQTFCIPTEGDNDADASTHEVAPKDAIFPNKEAREAFVANCIEAITKAETLTDLRTQKECNIAKWNAMKSSADPADMGAFDRIVAVYNPAFAKFKELAAAEPKPPTVEGAKRQLAAAVASDEIPF